MTSKQLSHLKRDKVLGRVISSVGPIRLKKDPDLYLALLRSIVGQQLSVKAAATIWARFLGLFPDGYPLPSQVMCMDPEHMRGAGLSYQKAGYIRNIAEFSQHNTLDHRQLQKMDDEELIAYLVQIKGVGRWTVEMILMFSLGRPDVFPRDDLGIRQGVQKLYKIRAYNSRSLNLRMNKIAEQWRPYRTLACMYIWRSRDLRLD